MISAIESKNDTSIWQVSGKNINLSTEPQKAIAVISPNGNIKVTLTVKPLKDSRFGTVSFLGSYYDGPKPTEVVTCSQLGLTRKNRKCVDSLRLLGTSRG